MNANRDLRVATTAAALLAALALAISVEWVSLLLLAPLAFFLTGYAILAAAFVVKPPPWPQTLAISVAISLAVLALLSLPLNYLGGLTPATWALGLVLVVAVACGVAALRRPPRWRDPREPLRLSRPAPLNAALGLGALLAVAAALVLAFVPLSATHAVGFTELWMRPFDTPAGAAVRVGVGNEEKQETDYLLRMVFRGGGAPIERQLRLAPGEASTLSLYASPQPTEARPTFVSVALFRSTEPDHAYRRVYGWVTAGGP